MTHDEAKLTFSRALDGELAPAARLSLDSHLEGCAECRSFVGGLGRSLGSLRGPEDREVMPERLHQRVMERVAATPQDPPPTPYRFMVLVAGFAAVAVALAFWPREARIERIEEVFLIERAIVRGLSPSGPAELGGFAGGVSGSVPDDSAVIR